MNQEVFKMMFDIIAALGSVATFGAFIFLFRRDKDKQVQIDRLTGIATILEAQNDTMKKQNDLMAQQVEIFRNTSILKGNDQGALEKLHVIEEKKLKLSVMPVLWTNGGSYNGSTGKFKLDLNNKGETAILLEFRNNSEDVIIDNLSSRYELEKGGSRLIFGQQKGSKHIEYCNQNIDIIYQDRLGNTYISKIIGQGVNIKLVDAGE
jgi:hypothetical protein